MSTAASTTLGTLSPKALSTASTTNACCSSSISSMQASPVLATVAGLPLRHLLASTAAAGPAILQQWVHVHML